jgi:hypothetical protein
VPKITINVPAYQGEYDLDLSGGQLFSYLEWRWIKKLSGYLPMTWQEGLDGGDPDLILAFAVIAMQRSGRIADTDVLTAAREIETAAVDGTSIRFAEDDAAEDGDADPQMESEPADSPPSSGADTTESSAPIPVSSSRRRSGSLALATGSDSDREISA